MKIEFHQWDWLPGFAAFIHSDQSNLRLDPDAKAFCVLNLGSTLATVAAGDLPASELPYAIAEDMMHEIVHALEAWAGVEFSEERVEALIHKYRIARGKVPPDAEFVDGEIELADKIWQNLTDRFSMPGLDGKIRVGQDALREAVKAAIQDTTLPEKEEA